MKNENQRPTAVPPPPDRLQESLVGSVIPDLAQAVIGTGLAGLGAVPVVKEVVKQRGETRREEIRSKTAIRVARTQNQSPRR